jgi:hypothetical protein
MAMKADWQLDRMPNRHVEIPPGAQAILEVANGLDLAALRALDDADANNRQLRLVIWDVARSRLSDEPALSVRFAVWEAAGQAIRAAASRALIEPPQDDDWRVSLAPAAGALRAVRFAAVAAVASEVLDPDEVRILTAPWRRVLDNANLPR